MNDITTIGIILIGLDLISLALLSFIFSYLKEGKDHNTPL